MPIYEYQCVDCNNRFEYLVMGGRGPEACPGCQGKKIKKQMSACGFLSKNGRGETVSASAGASACSGCAATSCAGCGH